MLIIVASFFFFLRKMKFYVSFNCRSWNLETKKSLEKSKELKDEAFMARIKNYFYFLFYFPVCKLQ